MKGVYKVADSCFEIESIYDDVHILLKDYIYSGDARFSIRTVEKDIDFERQKSINEDKKEGLPIRLFSAGYLETLAVYRKMANCLIDDNILLLHGSVVAVDGVGYMFTAKSGTGKSTHTKLYRELFGPRAVMINDDKPLVKVSDKVIVYGTPYDGKHHLSNNVSVPLRSICILERAENNHIEKISKRDAYDLIVQQTNRPNDASKLSKTLILIDELLGKVDLYRIGCNMNLEAAKMSYDKMKG